MLWFKKYEQQECEECKQYKDKIEKLEKQIKRNEDEINSLIKTTSKFERILNNSIPNKITYVSNKHYLTYYNYESKTRIYKNMKEYEIKGLLLRSPIFEDTERNSVILVKDKWTDDNDCEIERELLVDLANETCIETKYKCKIRE